MCYMILMQILSSFIQVLTPFFGHGDKNLKGRFNDEIKEKDKDIDAGKFASKELAGGNNRNIEEAPEERKNCFTTFNDD